MSVCFAIAEIVIHCDGHILISTVYYAVQGGANYPKKVCPVHHLAQHN